MQQTENVIHVIQGQFHVSDAPQDVLATVLGSCVAVCLVDPLRKIGGMNHFLLPGSDPSAGNNIRYGASSMEQLINGLMRGGALRSRLEAQIYGGGSIVNANTRIGESNVTFARNFLRDEGIRLVRWDTGGETGRRVRFKPATGEAKVIAFDINRAEASQPVVRRPVPRAPVGEVELF